MKKRAKRKAAPTKKVSSGVRVRKVRDEVTGDARRFVGSIRELEGAISTPRSTLHEWSQHEDAPARTKDGYDVKAWEEFSRGKKAGKEYRELQAKRKSDLEDIEREKKIEEREINIRLKMAELAEQREVSQVLCSLVGAFKTTFTRLKYEIGGDDPDLIGTCDEKFREAFENLRMGEWAKKKAFWSPIYAELSALLEKLNLGNGPSDTSATKRV